MLRGKAGPLPQCLVKFQEAPGTLENVLKAFALGGLTTPKLHLHSVESKAEGGNVTWEVKAIEAACFKPNVEEPQEGQKFPPQEIHMNRLSHYIALSKLSKAKAIFVLEHDATANALKAMLPHVVFKKSCKVPKGIIAQL